MLNSNSEGQNIHRSLTANSPAAAAICSSTLSSSSQAAGCTSPYMSSVRMGAALISSERGAGDKLITWREYFIYFTYMKACWDVLLVSIWIYSLSKLKQLPGCGCTSACPYPSSLLCWSRWVVSSWTASSGTTCPSTVGTKTSISHCDKDRERYKTVQMDRETHLFSLLGPRPDVPGGGAVLPQAVHRLTVHELDGTDQAGAGAAVVLVAARVAEVDVCADETLLVAQQDHNLDREGEEEESVCRRKEDIVRTNTPPDTSEDVRGARTCCGGSCPRLLLSPGPPVLCWVHWY